MNQIFRVFCINRFGLGPLHYISSRSDFGFEFAEIFVFEKRLPVLLSRRVADAPYHWVGELFFEYEYLREFEAKIGTARNVVYGTYAEPINSKTSENPVRFHVPFMFTLAVGDCANKNNWKHFLF